MTIDQLLDHLEATPGFDGDLIGHYNMSKEELERVAEKAETVEEFDCIAKLEDWWRDPGIDDLLGVRAEL